MRNRLVSHKLKKDSLDLLFEDELKNMKIYAFKRSKQNKEFMSLAINLSSIKPEIKETLLKEYFDLYKMVYRIRSMVSYYWEVGKDSKSLIKNLYFHNETFQRMVKYVQQKVCNIFEGTNPKHVALIPEPEKDIVVQNAAVRTETSEV